jgi:phosphoadenosine phosphosulfate reductase
MHITGIEPYEVVAFARQFHADVTRDKPKRSFFSLAKQIGFPTRRYRWCCRHLKENHCPKRGRLLLGVRAEESPNRAAKWQPVAWHEHARLWAICPLYDWTENDVWAFIRTHDIAYCSLYDEGFKRIGCVGCPLASAKVRRQSFERWPNIAERFRNLMQYLWSTRKQTVADAKVLWAPSTAWKSAEDMYQWYINNDAPGKEVCGAGERLLAD